MTIRSACDKGFTVYLAEQHKTGMEKALGKGVVVGSVVTGLLYGIDRIFNLEIEWYYLLSPFVLITTASVGKGAISANSEDLEHKEAFDAVCKKYSEEESGE